MDIRSEYEFVLPVGYADQSGTLHREGVMRLAMARDEIQPLSDLRVQRNRAYLIVVLLSRVVKKLGTLSEVHAGIVENLYAADLRFLEEMYNRINEDEVALKVTCPSCGTVFDKQLASLSEGQ